MRIIILDNGLESSYGHSYAINRALQHELRARDIDHAFYAPKAVEPATQADLGCIPHFSHLLYSSVPYSPWERWSRRLSKPFNLERDDDKPSEKRTAHVLNRSFASDLRRLPADVWEEENLVLFTGLMQHQVVGLAAFADRYLSSSKAKIVCQLMFRDDWLPWRGRAQLGARLYRHAFERLRPKIGRTVFFTTENASIGDYFLQTFGVPTTILPVPLQGAAALENITDRIQIGFFGYSKLEKGFQLLPSAIAICQAARQDLDFTVQVQHFNEEPAIVQAATAMSGMENVTILSKALSHEEFAARNAAMDIILLPYDPDQFGMRGSGIFTEAVSAGRVVVASKDTWAGRSVERGEAVGETFTRYTSEALAQAILALCNDLKSKRKLALEKAVAFAADHSIAAYVDALLAIGRRT